MMSSASQALIHQKRSQTPQTPVMTRPTMTMSRLEIKVTPPPEEIKQSWEPAPTSPGTFPEIKRSKLHGAQKSMYRAHILAENLNYMQTAVMSLSSSEKKLNIDILSKSLDVMIKRHEALRCIFIEENRQIQQIALPLELITQHKNWPLKVIDGSRFAKKIPPVSDFAQTLEILDPKKHLVKPFNLSNQALWRLLAVQFSESEWQLGLIANHIIFDIASQNIFFHELSIIYNTFLNGKQESDIPLPPPVSLCDVPLLSVTEDKKRFLENYLGGNTPFTLLPDHEHKNFRQKGERIPIKIDAPLVHDIKKAFVKPHGPTLFMTLLTSLYIILYRYTNQTDLLIFTASRNRPDDKAKAVLNNMVNTIPLRETFKTNITFNQLLAQVSEHVRLSLKNQIPIDELTDIKALEQIKTEGVMFVFNQAIEAPTFQGIQSTRPIALDLKNAKFNVSISLDDTGNGIEGILELNRDLFKKLSFQTFNGHFINLLKAALRHPTKAISEFNIHTDEENYFLSHFHEQKKTECRELPFELLTECANRAPNKKAVYFHPTSGKTESISYRQLAQECQKIAGFLQKNGCTPKRRVGISVSRNMNLVIATFAAMYSGATLVRLETELTEALRCKVADAQLTAIITDDETTQLFREMKEAPTTLLNISDKTTLLRNINQQHIAYVKPALTMDSLYSIEYTSGTTGKPKGACITQRGLANLIRNLRDEKISSPGVVTKVASLCPHPFDAFNFDWAMAFGHQCELHYIEKYSPEVLRRIIKEKEITVLTLSAQILKTLGNPEDLPSLHYVITMGATLDEETVNHWRDVITKRGGVFINGYGPTENTVETSLNVFEKRDNYRTINRPSKGIDLAIINTEDKKNEAPIGKPGEIWLSGNQVAQGYYRRPQLTAEAFPVCHYNRTEHRMEYKSGEKEEKKKSSVLGNPAKKFSRWYRTGDIGHIDTVTGKVIYDMRKDAQIKINGARIELDAVNAELMKQAHLIAEAAVLPSEDKQHLIAYIVPRSPDALIRVTDINILLSKTTLPSAAVVTQIIILKSMPLTVNGKVDTKALKSLTVAPPVMEEKTRPLSDTEDKLKKMLILILKNADIKLDDHFNTLGVKSQMMATLEIDINDEFKFIERFKIISLNLEDFTLERMAAKLDALPKQTSASRIAPAAAFFSRASSPEATTDFDNVLNPLGLRYPFQRS